MAEFDRFSLSLPPEMSARLDEAVAAHGYDSRSAAVRAALREFFALQGPDGDAAADADSHGVVVVVYDHAADGVAGRLQALQHEAGDAVVATHHVHLSADRCLESVAVDGSAERVAALADAARALDGVRRVRTVLDRPAAARTGD